MSDEIREILNIVKEFCFDYYIEILLCVNIVALIWTAICLIRLSRSVKKKEKCKAGTEMAEELTLSLNIKKADVNIGNIANINEELAEKPIKESGEKQAEEYAEECCKASTYVKAKAAANESDGIGKADRYCTSRNGRVYSETEILSKIKE